MFTEIGKLLTRSIEPLVDASRPTTLLSAPTIVGIGQVATYLTNNFATYLTNTI